MQAMQFGASLRREELRSSLRTNNVLCKKDYNILKLLGQEFVLHWLMDNMVEVLKEETKCNNSKADCDD